jgi:hypothetical protein
MRTRSTLIALALLLCLVPAQAFARDAFVGTWKIEVTPDEESRSAGAKEFKDVVTFKGMQFESKELKKNGFKAAPYEEDTRAGIVATFKCTTKSATGEGTAAWTGTSTGVDITGEMTWTKKDGTVVKYTFKGTKNQ